MPVNQPCAPTSSKQVQRRDEVKKKTVAAVSTKSVALLASNRDRVMLSVFNDADAALYLDYGDSVSPASFAVKLAPGGYFETPIACTAPLRGIWAEQASGRAMIREFIEVH